MNRVIILNKAGFSFLLGVGDRQYAL